MTINLNGHEKRVSAAVKEFWKVRERDGVRAGKTLDGFVNVLKWVVNSHGMPNATIHSGASAKVPGFFRPSKAWDLLIMDGDTLIAAIELKSIADAFGKNSNNRNEEALGSGTDIKEAFEEGAFDELTRLFTGYLILVEDCEGTASDVKIQMKYFKAMDEFVTDERLRNGTYERNQKGEFPSVFGASYMSRFEILCRRLMQKQLYTAACVIKSPRTAINDGDYGYASKETSIKAFLASLASHAIRDQ